jgi:hypothetical protein
MDRDGVHYEGVDMLNQPLYLRPKQRGYEVKNFSMTRSSLTCGNNKRDSLYLPPRNFLGRKSCKPPNMMPDRAYKPQSGGLAGPYVFEGPMLRGYGVPQIVQMGGGNL